MPFTFSCTQCGKCCKGGGPSLSIEEVFKYQDVFISGLYWSAHYVSDKPLSPSPYGLPIPSQDLRQHFSDFCASSTNTKGPSRYPFIYPFVSGYDPAPGRGCTALNADGTCSIHADKPQMCRSVPFDPAFPERHQGQILSRFKHDCMAETQDLPFANIIFSDGRIVDAEYKANYDARLDTLKRDATLTTELIYFLGDGHRPGTLGLPSLTDFMNITERGAWLETSMLPLLALLKELDPANKPRIRDYLAIQSRLIRAAIDTALQQRDKALRERTAIMRRYLSAYEATQEIFH